ncbi:hypothetical protein KVV02_007167 [Mortierella alpina]|uniref:Uncharacterized protein n=1 Tax=Mortierella alpina TaxID=64518 RepID=A0A9P8A3L7_MORAP|nr:hypothetical protein KVV02_007167 [Mortierella alpina]
MYFPPLTHGFKAVLRESLESNALLDLLGILFVFQEQPAHPPPMSDHEEQVTASEPRVEIVEETLPDGTIVRKKKTTRTITKRILTSRSSTSEVEQESSSSTSNTAVNIEDSHSHSETKEAKKEIQSAQESPDSAVSEQSAEGKTETTTTTTTTTTAATSTTASGSGSKFGLFGVGGAKDHPFYRFLARFPLRQSPAPHAYLKFNHIEFDIKPAFEPTMSPSGKLPFLALPNGSLVTADGFEAFVQENKPKSSTAQLNLDEAAEAVAFTALAESKIHSALIYTLWFEAPHFEATTRQHYFGHHNRLLATLLEYLEKSRIVQSMLLTRTQIDRELIFDEAVTAIDALAVELGDKNEYFFGKDEPSGLDAIVFAYLHVILTMPKIRHVDDAGRSGELARIVRKHENLFTYSQNIWKKWFSA